MPYDGSGNFSILNSFEEDRINGVSIDSLKMDNNFNDVANGLSNVMLRSGAAAMTGALNMASHKITNVTNGSASKDAVNKGQLDTGLAAKQNTITGGASTIATTNLTANCALVSNASGKVAVLSTVSNTELGYLDGVTSKIQTQLNAKAADNAVVHLSGNETIAGTKTFSSTINGNAATVTNGVYTTGNQTIGGTKTFSSSPIVPTAGNSDNSTKAASTAWVKNILEVIYPVGSIYVTTKSTCPLATLISGSTWEKVATSLVANITIPSSIAVYGNGKTLGLNDGTTNVSLFAAGSSTYGIEATEVLYNKNKGTVWESGAWLNSLKGLGVTTDTSGKSGLVAKSDSITQTTLTVNVWRRTA